jgi:DNA-binding HxlR family transcriptional regulator
MKRTSFESMPCPLARAADSLSDSWNVLILREAFYGSSRFDEFETSLGIASNTLTRRLKDLVDDGLLERRQYSEKPPRFEYVLTDKGRDFRPVMLTMLAWGNKHASPKGSRTRLVDTTTGEPVELKLIDARTGKAIGADHKVQRNSTAHRKAELFAFDGDVTTAPAAH